MLRMLLMVRTSLAIIVYQLYLILRVRIYLGHTNFILAKDPRQI